MIRLSSRVQDTFEVKRGERYRSCVGSMRSVHGEASPQRRKTGHLSNPPIKLHHTFRPETP